MHAKQDNASSRDNSTTGELGRLDVEEPGRAGGATTVTPIFNLRQRVITEFGAGFVVEIRNTLLDIGKHVYFVQHDFGGPASGFYSFELRAEPTV